MDFDYGPRAEQVPGRAARVDRGPPPGRGARGRARHRPGRRATRAPAELEPHAGGCGLRRPGLAPRVRRARGGRGRAARARRGDVAGRRARTAQPDRAVQHRPRDHGVRHARAAGALSSADAPGRRDLVSGLQRATGRQRPGEPADLRGRGRRRLDRQRAEDLEHLRTPRAVVRAAGANGPRRREARAGSPACSSTSHCPASRRGRCGPSRGRASSPSSSSPTCACPAPPCSARCTRAGRWR